MDGGGLAHLVTPPPRLPSSTVSGEDVSASPALALFGRAQCRNAIPKTVFGIVDLVGLGDSTNCMLQL